MRSNAPFQLLNMTAKAAPRPPPPADENLQKLRDDRANLSAELGKLQTASARLRETANAETSAINDIAIFTRSESDELTAWALDGAAAGKQPQPDQEKRMLLALSLSDARALSLNGEIAAADIDRQQRDVAERLAAVDRRLEALVLDRLQAEHAGALDEYRSLAERAQQLGARIHGLAAFFGERGRQLTSSGDPAGQQYLNRVSSLAAIKLPEFGCTRIEINIEGGKWAERAAALRSGRQNDDR